MLVPHASIPAVYCIEWQNLAALGFKGCVLDKDNTLTKPYSMHLEPGVQQSLAMCSRAFEGNMVLLSNSAGALTKPVPLPTGQGGCNAPTTIHKRKNASAAWPPRAGT